MTDPSMAPPAPEPDVAETVSFLRRFADLMSNGYNAAYLHRAAEFLETLTARVLAASDEDALWHYKYETLSHHAEALESEIEALKQDIEGHLDITSAVIGERDGLAATLQAREAELAGLRDAASRERSEHAAELAAQEQAAAGLRTAFDRERDALRANLEALATREAELSELRLAHERERSEFQAKLKVSGDELAAFRVVSEREQAALRDKVTALEAKRAELRSAFERIGDLRSQTIGHQDYAAARQAEAGAPATQPGEQDSAVGEANAVVPKVMLRQARDQFEYLARQFVPLGDIASQVMCELSAYNIDLALVAGQPADHLPVGDIARNILAPSGPADGVTPRAT